MWLYINPQNMSKERWLVTNGIIIEEEEARAFDFSGDNLPVCLVDNGAFSAAGIADSRQELEAFLYPDPRDKVWFRVSREALAPFMGRSD